MNASATQLSPKAPSRTDENKRLATTWLRWVSEGDVEAICQVTAPSWTMYGGPPALPQGPDGVRTLFASFGSIEQRWTPELVIAEGDYVVIRAVNHCKQERFFGVPANGRTQVFTATFIFHIVGGMVMEIRRNADDLGRLLQLGATIVAPHAGA